MMRLITYWNIMVKIVSLFKSIYQNTYQSKNFRDILNLTRLLIAFIDTLIIAFLVNLFLSGYLSEGLFIIIVVICITISYYLCFKYVYKQYNQYHNNRVKLNLKYVYHYLYIEVIVLSLLLIQLYNYIKSFYV